MSQITYGEVLVLLLNSSLVCINWTVKLVAILTDGQCNKKCAVYKSVS